MSISVQQHRNNLKKSLEKWWKSNSQQMNLQNFKLKANKHNEIDFRLSYKNVFSLTNTNLKLYESVLEVRLWTNNTLNIGNVRWIGNVTCHWGICMNYLSARGDLAGSTHALLLVSGSANLFTRTKHTCGAASMVIQLSADCMISNACRSAGVSTEVTHH